MAQSTKIQADKAMMYAVATSMGKNTELVVGEFRGCDPRAYPAAFGGDWITETVLGGYRLQSGKVMLTG